MENEYFIKNVLENPDRNVEFAAAAVYADIIEDLSRDAVQDESYYSDVFLFKLSYICDHPDLFQIFIEKLIDMYSTCNDAFVHMILSKGLWDGYWYYEQNGVIDTTTCFEQRDDIRKAAVAGLKSFDKFTSDREALSLVVYMIDRHCYNYDIMSFIIPSDFGKYHSRYRDDYAKLYIMRHFDYNQILGCFDLIFIISTIINSSITERNYYEEIKQYVDLMFDLVSHIGANSNVTDPTYDPVLYETSLRDLILMKPIVELKLRILGYYNKLTDKDLPEVYISEYFLSKMKIYDEGGPMYIIGKIAYIDFVIDIYKFRPVRNESLINTMKACRSLMMHRAFMAGYTLEFDFVLGRQREIAVGVTDLIVPPLTLMQNSVITVISNFKLDRTLDYLNFGFYSIVPSAKIVPPRELVRDYGFSSRDTRDEHAFDGWISQMTKESQMVIDSVESVSLDPNIQIMNDRLVIDNYVSSYMQYEHDWFRFWTYIKSNMMAYDTMSNIVDKVVTENTVLILNEVAECLNLYSMNSLSQNDCLSQILNCFRNYMMTEYMTHEDLELDAMVRESFDFHQVMDSAWAVAFLGEYYDWIYAILFGIKGLCIDKIDEASYLSKEFFLFVLIKMFYSKSEQN